MRATNAIPIAKTPPRGGIVPVIPSLDVDHWTGEIKESSRLASVKDRMQASKAFAGAASINLNARLMVLVLVIFVPIRV